MISVIIPIYNERQWLTESLSSLVRQTYRQLEIIIVDDGSSPVVEIPEFPERKNLPEIRLIRQQNSGAPAARNRGFAQSHGEYVIFWDADIIAKSDMLEKMLLALKNNQAASYAYCNFMFGWKKMMAMPFNREQLQKNNYISNMSLIKRVDFPGYDTSLKRLQDWDLWLTMLENSKDGVWVNEYLFTAKIEKMKISHWLPRFAYKMPFSRLPWFKEGVREFEASRQIIFAKHELKF